MFSNRHFNIILFILRCRTCVVLLYQLTVSSNLLRYTPVNRWPQTVTHCVVVVVLFALINVSLAALSRSQTTRHLTFPRTRSTPHWARDWRCHALLCRMFFRGGTQCSNRLHCPWQLLLCLCVLSCTSPAWPTSDWMSRWWKTQFLNLSIV